MTIAGYNSLYVLTVALVAFGGLTFSVLALYYWRHAAARRDPVFAAFTAVCAAAFLLNLLARVAPGWEAPLFAMLDVTSCLAPALLFHVVSGRRRIASVLYAASAAVALALLADDCSVIDLRFRYFLPAILLAAASALGVVFAGGGTRLRIVYRGLLGLTAAATVAGLLFPIPEALLAADFLVLAFFCVTLYARERVLFFDLLIKRGAFLVCAWAALFALLAAAHVPDRLTVLLLLTPLWLLAPWVDSLLGRAVDRFFLRRRHSPLEAERLVLRQSQAADSEEDLRRRVEAGLAEVFACTAEARFAWPVPEMAGDGLTAAMPGLGQVTLRPRASGIPYMTGDRRLLDSLARSLAVVLENVRLREQQARHLEREQQLRLLASRAELKALRAQIDPHFLFNALNAVAGFLPSQPEMADYAIEQLAQIFRYTLRKSEREWARLDEEAEFAAAWLRMEQARFGDRLQVELSVDPAARRVSVPAMCVQPLIENAIRHGTSAVEGPGTVRLRIAVAGEMASIEVCDNGPGFPPGFSLAGSAGHGLRNISERLKGYYGDSARLRWESGAGDTRVRLEIPLEAAAAGETRGRDTHTDRG